jgi:hypothetical protein
MAAICAVVVTIWYRNKELKSKQKEWKSREKDRIDKEYAAIQPIRTGPFRKLAEKLEEKNSSLAHTEDTETRQRDQLAKWYQETFHAAPDEFEERKICTTVMNYLEQLESWEDALEKATIDKDLLFTRIGTALKIDDWALRIVIKGHQLGHPKEYPYSKVEILLEQFEAWKKLNK